MNRLFARSSSLVWGVLVACASRPMPIQSTPTAMQQPSQVTTAPREVFARPSRQSTQFLTQWSATGRYGLGAPSRMKFSPDGSTLYFLRSAARSAVRDLWIQNARTGEARVLVTADTILHGAQENLTAEERARRERQRQTGRGITSYELSHDGATLLIPLSGKRYLVNAQTGVARELASTEQTPCVDSRFSPDGRMIACVRGGEVYVTELATSREHRVTTPAGPGISHGLAEFVAQEEMDRSEGYWWSPDSQSLVVQRTDENAVELLGVFDPTHPEQALERNRYPRAGRTNATVSLEIWRVAAPTVARRPARPTAVNVQWDREALPYLAKVVWSANAPLTIVLQNRTQTQSHVCSVNPTTGAITPLHVERDDAWVNLDPEMPRWLADGTGFLWSSERSGQSTLELRSASGALVRTLGADTRYRSLISLDAGLGIAWVSGGEEPTETHVFRVQIATGISEQVTRGAAEHEVIVAPGGAARAHTVLALAHARVWQLETGAGALVAPIPSLAEEPTNEPRVELRTVGESQWRTAIVRPRNFDPTLKYPVIDAVYGGPHSRVVTSARHRYAFNQWLADHGFIVVAIDGRGTPFRGREWERSLRGRLGDTPLQEHVDALRALGASVPEMDLSRVGVYGWSFGGYLSALTVLRRPDVFHAAVAGAPVTDWRDYDTHYTERYMGLPDRESAAYDRASLLTGAEALRRPLLLVHGTADDNVYYTHSARLADALFRAGRQHEMLSLVGFTHLVPDPVVTERLYARVADFFVTHLAHAPIEDPQ
ncbi:MAG: DPP IV N-terminal domain-containing protein [Deltaproteobacteria bacterium]|nr:DPP IV N-terminal domain-containing protein [Deltaproteobacteria bacterium]